MIYFDVGIDNEGKVISLRTQADVLELWAGRELSDLV